MQDIKKIIGINLRYIRFQEGLSQEKFCDKYKFSTKYFSTLERGEANIKVDTLQLIAEVLKVSPVELITFDNKKIIHKKRIDEKS